MQIIVYRNANKFCLEKEQLIITLCILTNFVSIYKFTPVFVTVDVCMCPLIFFLWTGLTAYCSLIN